MQDQDQPEPTIADVFAAVTALSDKVERIETTTGAIHADLGQLRTEMGVKLDLVSADIAQLRADVLHAKVEATMAESRARDAQTAIGTHLNDPRPHGKQSAA